MKQWKKENDELYLTKVGITQKSYTFNSILTSFIFFLLLPTTSKLSDK